MKCANCGNELTSDGRFCPLCGSPVQAEMPQYAPQPVMNMNPLYGNLPAMFKDKMFFVLCILVSVATALSFAAGTIPIILVLFTIFLWKIYANAQNNVLQTKDLRNVSGTIYASYIITWVAVGLLAFVAIVMIMLLNTRNDYSALYELYSELISEYEVEAAALNGLTIKAFTIIAIVTLIVIAIGVAIVNIFGMGSIHKFAKSLYVSNAGCQFLFEKVNAAKAWLLVFGIGDAVSALSALGDTKMLVSALSTGCSAAFYIVAYLMVSKYFKQQPAM